jgi:IS1 family transposase
MNKLTTERRAAVVKALVEGNSIRATVRLTGVAKNTIAKLLVELGAACIHFHDVTVRRIEVRRIQCDEIWSFVGCKERNVRPERREETGDLWTWAAIDAETKLTVSWHVGGRSLGDATAFARDLASRLSSRVQLTTDGHKPYLQAVESAFGWNGVDYAMLEKIYGTMTGEGASRFPSPVVVGTRKTLIMGQPREEHVSTSFVERQNLTMRMGCRRFTRLTNGYSKKIENHKAAVALHFVHYNFCRVHHTLTRAKGGIHQTPAMAAGLTDRVWIVSDLISLLESQE